MSLTADHLRRLARVVHARDLGFVDLVGLAEVDPASAFRGVAVRWSMRGQNLAGFDFTDADFSAAPDLRGADLSYTTGITPEMLDSAITDHTTIRPRNWFWAEGQAPTWAHDWGRDQYGAWVSFRVPNTEVTQRMRWCPPGEFMMGSPESEPGRWHAEGPRHRVVIDHGFWMFDTACTEDLWITVMQRLLLNPRGGRYPVVYVDWIDARDFALRLNDLVPGLCIDLPSEACWEYACRAGTTTRYNFGDRPNKAMVCYDSRAPVEVGSMPPNRWGLFETHGNVWEWCLDDWHASYDGAPADGSVWLEQYGQVKRVVRGGAWNDVAGMVRAAYRDRDGPAVQGSYLGFRCARIHQQGESARALAPANAAGRSLERRSALAAADTAARMVADPKPDWATTAGRDQYGRYAIIQIPGTDVTQRLRWIEPGQFLIGAPHDEVGGYPWETPRTLVIFDTGFWLFDSPVTQALWQAVTGTNPSRFKSPDRPVESVNVAEATAFMDRLNALIPGLRLTLPSEAEWEYACRAGTQTATYAGDLPNGGEKLAPILNDIAWYAGNSSDGFEIQDGHDQSVRLGHPRGSKLAGTRPVGQKRPNNWGLFDMLGNVWEWCADHWRGNRGDWPSDGSAWRYETTEVDQILRGGSWNDDARVVRAAYRTRRDPENHIDIVGFRCVRTESDSEAERRAR